MVQWRLKTGLWRKQQCDKSWWGGVCRKASEQALCVIWTFHSLRTNRLAFKVTERISRSWKNKRFLKLFLTFRTRPLLIRKLHKGRSAASLIHTLCNELMNYEFSGGNNGFVRWRSSRNDSRYKWKKKRLAHFQSAIMEMSGHFFRLSCKGS